MSVSNTTGSGTNYLSDREIHYLATIFHGRRLATQPAGEQLGVRTKLQGLANMMRFLHDAFTKGKELSAEEKQEKLTRLKQALLRGLQDLGIAGDESLWDRILMVAKEMTVETPWPPIDPAFRDDLETVEGWGDAQSGNELEQVADDQRDLWNNHIPMANLTLFASSPYLGKSTLGIDLERHTWLGIPLYGQTRLVYPAGTSSLWFCGDFNESEVIRRGGDFGLPGDAFYFADLKGQSGRMNLEDPKAIKLLEHYLAQRTYAFVFFDNIWRLTSKEMHKTKDVKELFQPYAELAQRANKVFIFSTHTSKDGDALGRRPEGVFRSIIKLYPTEDDSQRRLTTESHLRRKPADLLMTIRHDRLEFGEYSPEVPVTAPRKSPGRPSDAREEAAEFILQVLSTGPKTWKELNSRWTSSGGSRPTLLRARDDLKETQEIQVTECQGETWLELPG
jgi:hypothetical protein